MIQIDLVRHGNTFDKTHPEERHRTVVWCGARTNLPLVPSGLVQAVEMGQMLKAAGRSYDKIYAGPLIRTQQTAQIIAHIIGYPLDQIVTTDNLLEMDYGSWEGVSDKETQEKFPEEYRNWDENRIAPTGAGFTPAETLRANVRADFDETIASGHQRILKVTSNGLMSYFASLAGEDIFESMRHDKQLKVATGAMCRLSVDDSGAVNINFWNKKPAEAAVFLTQ